jgi:CubicO group peptidase (beta-lactamase class C family)
MIEMIKLRSAAVILSTLMPLTLGSVAAGAISNDSAGEVAPTRTLGQLGRATLDQVVPASLAKHKVPGVSIAIIADGKIVEALGYGFARQGDAVTPNTPFNIASLTKPVVAEVLLRAAERGQIDLNEPMARYWLDPDIADDPRAQKITAAMALTHRTGLPNWRNQTGNKLQFVQDPDTSFRYGGEQFTYAVRYAEARTKTKFETLAKRLLLDEAKMQSTRFTVWKGMGDVMAYPHDASGNEDWPVTAYRVNGACCTYSTASDYARFLGSVMTAQKRNPGPLRAKRFEIVTDRRNEVCGPGGMPMEICPPEIGVNSGWFVFRIAGRVFVNHTGANPGEKSLAMFEPATGNGLVVLTNGANGNKVIDDILRALDPSSPFLSFTSALAG